MKIGHIAAHCWYRYDEDFMPDNRVAGMASTSNAADPNWYLDSGATNHITRELEKLTIHEPYHGNNQIRAVNSEGMDIVHVGNTVLSTSTRPLHLNHLLHVPHTHKQLVSIHQFNIDNNTFIELHPMFFLIMDRHTKRVLLCGPCRGGLYPIPLLPQPAQRILLSAIKSLLHRWHYRLGHPSHEVVRRVLTHNNLVCSGFDSDVSVCDACL
jgi:hypothetical protein